jgi:hypothetical protein
MTDGSEVDDEMVAVLARAADLPLAEDRRAVVREVLGAWLPDANELSRKMSEPEHWTVTPATVFTHPTPGEDL